MKWLYRQLEEWENLDIITPFQGEHIRAVVKENYQLARAKYVKLLFCIMGIMILIFVGLFGLFW